MRRIAIIFVLSLTACPRPQPEPKTETAVAPAQAPSSLSPNPSPNPNPAPPAAPPNVPVAPKPRPAKIKITIRSNPPKAFVRWGKKVLGQTPVIFERPRDSGPVDLIVFNEGFFPVHTRAYTFRNDALNVKLTRLEDRMTLFGAKKELEAPPLEVPPSLAPDAPPPALSPLEPQPE